MYQRGTIRYRAQQPELVALLVRPSSRSGFKS